MEAPPFSTPPPTTPTNPTPTPAAAYPDSAVSSPHSSKNDSFEADPPPPVNLRLMCSYGGHIVPRPRDKTLCYVGGETRIIVIDRHISLSDLHHRLSRNLFHNQPFSLKYQLPNEDLDSLITVTSDEDLENMVEEYDRLKNAGDGPGRLRLFLFPKSSSSIEQLLVETASTKSEDWFFNALNGKTSLSAAGSDRMFSESSSVNCLLGLDDEFVGKAGEKDVEPQIEGSKIVGGVNGYTNCNYGINQDVHSMPDSPMLETVSSFGSTSSSPSATNLPPISVPVEENPMGIEGQFQHMSVGVVENVIPPMPEVGRLVSAGVASGTAVSGLPVVVGGGEYANRVLSDDERSDHGGQRKAQQVQHAQLLQLQQQQQVQHAQLMEQQQQQQQVQHAQLMEQQQQQQVQHAQLMEQQLQQQVQHAQLMEQQQQIPQFQHKQANAFDLTSPDSVSSEGSFVNPLYRQRQAIYQEPLTQIQSGNSGVLSNQIDLKSGDKSNSKIQMQPQFQESGYVVASQYDQNQLQLHQPQQLVHAGNHYIPSSAVPISSYYSVYPSQQQHQSMLDQRYPVYFVSGRQTQSYNLPVQQPSYSELAPNAHSSQSQSPNVAVPNMAYNQMRNAPSSKPEMASAAYRTTAPQLVQVPSGQHPAQFMDFGQIHHPSSAASSTYEFSDPIHAQMYYTPLPPRLAAQYQNLTSAPAMIAPDAPALHPPYGEHQTER